MKMRHKILAMLLLLSLTAIMFFPTSNNNVLLGEDDSVNPSSITDPVDGITTAGVNDPYIDTVPVVEDSIVIDTAPNSNYNGDGLWVGLHAVGYYGRGWLKFDLPVASSSYEITRARMLVYLENDQYLVDVPIGAYYSSDDSWDETAITWNNQPIVDAAPLDIIDSPTSPNMFVSSNYYSWDVTGAASESILDDGVLSVMLKQENESLTNQTSKYFSEKDSFNPHPAYLQFEWETGQIQNATVPILEEETVYDGSPNTNLHGSETSGGIFVGRHTSGAYGRGWFKFNLSTIPDAFHFSSARMYVYLENEYADLVDAPIGAYYSTDNSWSETTITWNNQPSSDFAPLELIDSPASPDMFEELNYYSWDISSAVRTSMIQDDILSIVLRQENESIDYDTFKYFVEREYNNNHSAYILLEWHSPSTTQLTVDGQSETPHLNYISNPNPEFGWTFTDGDISDSQTNYEVELQDDGANQIWNQNQSNIVPLFDQGTDQNARPFASPSEMKFQFKYPSSLIPNSGIIDKLYFDIDLDTAVVTYTNFTLFMLSMYNDTALSTDFTGNYDGGKPKTVFFSSEYSPEIRSGQLIIDIWNNFFVNKDMDLLIEIKYTSETGPTPISSNHSVASTGSVAYTLGNGAYHNGTAEYTYGRTHNLYFNYATDIVREGGPSTHVYPFHAVSPLTIQMKYNKSLLEHTGFIDRLYFRVENMSGSLTLHNFTLSLVESPLDGSLGYNFIDNYGGAIPTVVIDEVTYEISYDGYWLIIDVPDIFYYSGLNDLLVEIRYSAVTGAATLSHLISSTGLENGGSRAYGYSISSDWAVVTDNNVYDLAVDIVNPESSITYDGPTLVNGTTYTLKVRTRDTFGMWGPWSELNFTTNTIGFAPAWDYLYTSPGDIITLGTSTTISTYVHHPEGIEEVLFSGAGVNHTMNNVSNVYSYTWTPPDFGSNPFTIYMRSALGYWNTTAWSIITIDGFAPSVSSIERNPLTPSDAESVTITANVTDQIAVSTVILYYNDGSQTYNVTMSSSGSLYEGIIPAFPRGTSVLYQIFANDSSDNYVFSSASGYTVVQSSPLWSDLNESSGSIELGNNVTVSINASHTEGMSLVRLEVSGSNYTMLNASGIYTWTWTPNSIGQANYVIYMLSSNGYWNTTFGSIDVVDTTDPTIEYIIIAPLSPTEADSVIVTANLDDLGGFQEVILQYDIGSGWTNVTMTTSGGVFTGEIPALPSQTVVTFRIYAIDPSGNWILSAENSYTVIGLSTTTTTSTTTPTTSPTITTTITDPTDLGPLFTIVMVAAVVLAAIVAILGLRVHRKNSEYSYAG
ncbi:MAG: DNRLRE domain-containing protein [Candidatus Thorarchaeota archaeon]|nr:DNRLRE domain-containing protein [Candidatus Thorarchaeota archaeon]